MSSERKVEKPWNEAITREQEFKRFENFMEEQLCDDDCRDSFEFWNEYRSMSETTRKRIFSIMVWLMER